MNIETLTKTLTLSNGKQCPLVQIGWIDAVENKDGWHTEKEMLEWGETINNLVHQTGWIVEENDIYIFLVSRYDEPNENMEQLFSGLFKIPKTWIVYHHELIFKSES